MKKVLLVCAAAVAIVYVAALFFFDPAENGFFPGCLSYSLFGIKCAGCGGQRAIHALLHGDVLGAIRYNCFLTVLFPLFVAGMYKGILARKKWFPYVVLSVTFIYIVLRNIPGCGL